MNFEHPKVLWVSLVVLPLLGLFLWATWRKRRALIRQFLQHKILAQQTLGTSFGRQKLRRLLQFFAVALLLFAIAGPQWGFTWEEATQRGRDIIVAIDTSRSMLAEDIEPNRLARAKLAALDLLQIGKYDRFGLVAFAGTAFLQCPLTFDDEAFRQNVRLLEPGIIPQGGTAIGQAIQAAREAFEKDADDNHRVLILFTDGEDHEEGVMEEAREAAADGMKIFTVGVGSAAGELLRVRDERGNMSFLKDEAGNVVKSRLNEELLQNIASATGGFYLPLQGGNAMELLYQKGLAELPTSERTTKLMKQFKERFYWPLAAAILLLMIEIFVPEQSRAPRKNGSNTLAPVVPATVALLAFLVLVPEARASASQAQRYYQQGQYQRALSEYQEALSKGANDPRLHYNAGAAAYHAEKFDLAMKAFQAAAGSADLDLQQQSFYNMANAEFRLGEGHPDPQQKMALWEQAVQHYDTALKINSQDKDAEFNRDLVKKKLEELKQQQQQEQKKNQNQDNKDDNREDKEDSSKEDQQKENKDQQEKDSQEQKQEENNQQDEQSQEQNKQEQEKQQQQDQQKPGEQKNDQPQPSQEGSDKDSADKPQQGEEAGEAAQLGQMTPAQAKQLLDAQREEEKALIFVPSERKSDARNRTFKDW